MERTRVWALHATIVDGQREVAEQHDLNNIWPHMDPM
jgi:hypothetical protein